MNYKSFILNYITVSLLMFVFFSTFFIISCEKELSVPSEPATRNLKGRVIDSITNNPIADAFVQIKTEDSNKLLQIRTNANGDFEIEAPVYPETKPYQVLISANGYKEFATVAECNCEVLEIGLIPLEKFTCGISFSPTNTINFDSVKVGVRIVKNFWIKNPTNSIVSIDSIRLSKIDFTITNLNFPISLIPNDSILVNLELNAKNIGPFIEQLTVFTDCIDAQSINAFLIGEIIQAECGLEIFPTEITYDPVAVNDTINGLITIRNPYQTNLTIDSVNFSPPHPDYHISDSSLAQFPRQLPSGSSISLNYWIVPQNQSKTISNLTVYTGGCSADSIFNSKIRVNAFFRLCNIEPSFEQIKMDLSNPDTFVVVQNRSNNLSLTLSFTNNFTSDSAWFQITPSSPIIIPPSMMDTIFIKWNYENISVSRTFIDSLKITTNGDCATEFELFAQYNGGQYETGILNRWSVFPGLSNPDELYRGFNFDQDAKVPDQFTLCPGDTLFSDSTTNAQFRFDGIKYTIFGIPDSAIIRAHYGMKHLGNLNGNNFTQGEWETKILTDPDPWTDGCSDTAYREGDVLVLKRSSDSSNNYVLLQLEQYRIDSSGFETLIFNYIVID